MKLRGRSPSCGIYIIRTAPSEARGGRTCWQNPSLYLYFPFYYITDYIKVNKNIGKNVAVEFHFIINRVEFHFESCNFILKHPLLLEFHFPTPTTPTLPPV